MSIYFNSAELAELFNILNDTIYEREKEIKLLKEYEIDEEYWHYNIKSNIDLLKDILKKVVKGDGIQTKLEKFSSTMASKYPYCVFVDKKTRKINSGYYDKKNIRITDGEY